MIIPTPILATARTAAALLDMREPEFLRLVDAGHLPEPVELGGFVRWDVDLFVESLVVLLHVKMTWNREEASLLA